MQRLDKLLGHMGVGTRREIKQLVKERRVTVDGALATDPGQQVDPARQSVTVDGKPIAFQRHFYVLLHKPGGVVTATEDSRQRTVMDVVPPELLHRDLFPVGRLDKDTEGLLLLTTDGELGHRLLSPRWHVDKIYLARLESPLADGAAERFATGVTLADGYECMPARLEALTPQEVQVTIQEGKYHQVKRMFEAVDNQVVYLKRLAMGPLSLGDLPYGEARPLTEAEIDTLYRSAELPRP